MFMDCESLANIDGLAGWDTSAVETMDSMFQDCQALTNVDALTDWNTHNVKSMNTMFNHCSSLSDVYGLVDWDTSSVKSMGAIFADCLHLPPSRYIEAFQTKQAAPTTQPTAKPYIPKSQTTDKTRDAEPER
jgi:surface protein